MPSADPSNVEYAAPTPGAWPRYLLRTLVVVVAVMGPLLLIARFQPFSTEGQSERMLYWKLAAFVGYYTLAVLFAVAVHFRRAMRIWRSQCYPYPGQLVLPGTRVRRGMRARASAMSAAFAGLFGLAGLVYGWWAMQLPAIFFGIGEYRVNAPVDCPAADSADGPEAPANG